jgi:hypothetical protein
VAAKIKETDEADFFRVRKWTNRPKCDIVDTNPHASCAPGIIGTNNTAFLLYGSGLDKQKDGTHKKPNGHDFKWFQDLCCATEFCANGVHVESLWDGKADDRKEWGFRPSFARLFLDFWLKVDMAGCNGPVGRSSMPIF